jgi:hypothetical protein
MGSRSLHSQIKEGKNSPQLNDVEEVRAGKGPLLGVPESFGSQLIGVLINVGGVGSLTTTTTTKPFSPKQVGVGTLVH